MTSLFIKHQFFTSQEALSGCDTDPASLSVSPSSLFPLSPSLSPSLSLSVGVRRGLNESLISSCWMSLRWWQQFSCGFKGNWGLTKFGFGFCFSPLNQLGASHQVQVARLLSGFAKTTVKATKPKWQWSVIKGREKPEDAAWLWNAGWENI